MVVWPTGVPLPPRCSAAPRYYNSLPSDWRRLPRGRGRFGLSVRAPPLSCRNDGRESAGQCCAPGHRIAQFPCPRHVGATAVFFRQAHRTLAQCRGPRHHLRRRVRLRPVRPGLLAVDRGHCRRHRRRARIHFLGRAAAPAPGAPTVHPRDSADAVRRAQKQARRHQHVPARGGKSGDGEAGARRHPLLDRRHRQRGRKHFRRKHRGLEGALQRRGRTDNASVVRIAWCVLRDCLPDAIRNLPYSSASYSSCWPSVAGSRITACPPLRARSASIVSDAVTRPRRMR